jgi:tyrosyl-tRNA synthetase
MPLLRGTDGEQKMSKSYDNYIGLTDSPEDMFGKTMSIPDTLLEEWYQLASLLGEDELAGSGRRIKEEPYQAKRELGRIIVQTYYDEAAAQAAEAHFDRLFKQKALPDEIPEVTLSLGDSSLKFNAEAGVWLPGVLVATGLASSNSEAVRLIEQGAVAVNEERVTDRNAYVPTAGPTVLRRGKRQFVQVRFHH